MKWQPSLKFLIVLNLHPRIYFFSFYKIILNLVIIFFWLYCTASGVPVPQPGTELPSRLHWKLNILTTGPPGKSSQQPALDLSNKGWTGHWWIVCGQARGGASAWMGHGSLALTAPSQRQQCLRKEPRLDQLNSSALSAFVKDEDWWRSFFKGKFVWQGVFRTYYLYKGGSFVD